MADSPDFIPDSQFKPDAGPAPASSGNSADFIPDSQFVSDEEKHGGLGSQIGTGIEGALSAATFGLSTGLEKKIGKDLQVDALSPENIRARREVNPVSHGAGQIAGLVGSSFLIPGGGAAGLLERGGASTAEAIGLGAEATALRAGEAAAEAAAQAGLGKAATSAAIRAAKAQELAQFGTMAKIGSSAVKAAADNALFQAGDEVSKMLASDNSQDAAAMVQSSAVNIGLAGLLGAGIGGGVSTLSPLWKATAGPKVSSILDAITKRSGGVEAAIPDALNEAIEKTGVTIAPEVRASLSSDPEIRQMFQTLQDSAGSKGHEARESLNRFRSSIAEKVAEATGRTVQQVEGLVDKSNFETGSEVLGTLTDELKRKTEPVSDAFKRNTEKYKTVDLTDLNRGGISEELTNLVKEKGYNLATNSDEMKIVNQAIEDLPNLKTVEDLRKYQSNLGSELARKQMWDLGKGVRSIFNEAEGNIVSETIGKVDPGLLPEHVAAKANYKSNLGLIEELNDRLHAGRYSGPESFMRAMNEMKPEEALNRLLSKKDAGLLNLLETKFPETAAKLKEVQIDQMLKKASMSAPEGAPLNIKNLFKQVDALSPELKKFMFDGEAGQKLEALRSLSDAIPEKIGKSGTPQGLDALWGMIPASAVGMVSLLTGHSATASFLLGGLTKALGRDIPDAVRMGLLKFLGSGQKLEAEGFKAMVDTISQSIKAENTIGRAAKEIFKAGKEVIPSHLIPDNKSREKLDKKLKELQTNQTPLFDVGGKTAHYLPEHGTAIASTAMNAVNYLNSMRPIPQKQSPLDSEPVVTKTQTAAFNKALDIAQQPLVVMEDIKNGTISASDIKTLHTVYPALYNRLSDKLNHHMIEAVNAKENIPYKTRMGVSMFLGQPLDSTLKPNSIVAAQATFMRPSQQKDQQAKQQQGPGPHSMKGLAKLPAQYATPQQAREASKLKA